MSFRNVNRWFRSNGVANLFAQASGMQRAALATSLLGAAGLARFFAFSDGVEQSSGGKAGLSVMTWNVLARPYTIYNAKFHRAQDKVEDPGQTRSRYTLAGERIVSTSADVVLLQECEAEFFDPEWNMAAPKLLQDYRLFPCRQHAAVGTAVLIKRAGRATALADRPICVGGTGTGGPEKIATVVPVRVGPHEVSVVSSHFSWDGAAEKRLHHVQMLDEILRGQTVVLGGDFNCQPGPKLDELSSATFLGDLRRAEPRAGADVMTGLTSDFSKEICIDHIFVPSGAEVMRATPMAKPASPWGGKKTRPAKVAGASDHVPFLAEISL